MSNVRRIAVAGIGVLLVASVAALATPLWGKRTAPPPGPGDTTVVYGPHRFTTPTGSSTIGVESFTLTVQPATRYLLKLANGNPDGTNRASTINVVLNGATIITAAQLASDYSALRTVQALSTDTLKVTVAGNAGAFVDVSILSVADPAVYVFGPTTFVRQTGQPETEYFTFDVNNARIGSPFLVCVQNGRVDGSQRSSSASIKLNGVEILTQAELSQQVGGLVKSVTLLAHNTLEVRMTSVPTSELTLCFQGTDIGAPILTIAAPAPGLITADATVSVTGTVVDETATSVYVNGTLAARNGDNYSATANLAEGNNTILVHALDAAGNTTDSSRSVIRDSQAPALTVNEPADGLITNTATVTVSGTVADATTTTVNVNGTPVAVTGGAFSTTVTVVEGSNFITVSATDQANNVTSVARQVTLDTSAPVIVIDAPAEGFLTNAASVTVSGTITDATAVSATVNGVAVTLGAGGSYSASAALTVEGNNTITVAATDAAGNSSSATRTVTRDTQAPTLTVSAPENNAITGANTIHVTGTVADASAVTVTVNGVAATVTAGAFDVETALPDEGANVITVVATDAATNASTETRTVIRDTQAPTLTVVLPADFTITKEATIDVTGTVTDATAVTLVVNGVTVTVAPDGSFSASVPLATEGENPIAVVATDAAGNVSQAARTVIRDSTAPTLIVSAPANGTYTNQQTVHVTGTVSDATAVSVNVNGIPAFVNGFGAFDVEVTLGVEGENLISIVATDAANNVSADLRAVIRDTQAPSLTVTTPTEGLETLTPTITVTGTVTDASPFGLTVNGEAVTVAGNGSFSKMLTLTEGPNTITVVATDTATNASTVVRHVVFVPREPGVHPDPSTTAPPLDRSIATLQSQATTFLYADTNPIQVGVPANTIDPVRAATVRGRVFNRDMVPVQGVKVSVHKHPEYGYTLSRMDGAFDLVVNGGAPLSFDYAKTGYLPAQRTASIPWQDWYQLTDVVLLQVDSVVTPIAINSPVTQIARASVQTDVDGARQATAIFKPGTTATMTLANGTVVPMTSMAIRMTEFTVGENGRLAMPAELPPTSAYTYAAQMTADEALAAGATKVTLSQPVSIYTENFIQVPVGTGVPVGEFDPDLGWVPKPNGAVVSILTNAGGTVTIDTNGDGIAETDAALIAMGIDAGEREKLAATYTPGQSLWRFATFTHFPYDKNYQGVLQGVDPSGDVNTGCTGKLADPIKCDIQVARQQVGLTGTPYALVYGSDRSIGGADKSLSITLTGPTILPELHKVQLTVSVGGKAFFYAFEPQANLIFPFTWDGRDVYGRLMQGNQRVGIAIDHVYPVVYQKPPNPVGFANTCDVVGGATACNLSAIVAPESPRQYWRRSQKLETTIGGFDAKGLGLGGFTLSAHHVYDPIARVVYQGDGTTRAARRLPEVVKGIAGSPGVGFSGDGGPATLAKLAFIASVSVGPDGSVYLNDTGNCRIRKIAPNGIITTVMGTGVCSNAGNELAGENGSPLLARIPSPAGVHAAPDGGFLIWNWSFQPRLKRVGADGILRTIAFQGTTTSGNGDGGPALAAKVTTIMSPVFGPDGSSIYLSDRGNSASAGRIRRIGSDGIITSVVGNGVSGCTVPGPARQTPMSSPEFLAFAPDGSLYFTEFGCAGPTGSKIFRLSPDGMVTHVAGTTTDVGDLTLAINRSIRFVDALTIAKDGALFVHFNGAQVWRITQDGKFRQMCACGFTNTPAIDGNVWAKETMSGAASLTFGPDGALYFGQGGNAAAHINQVRRVSPPTPGVGLGETAIASSSGGEIYVFDINGRHLRTMDALTPDTIFSFGYDANGRIVSITDPNKRVTTFERDATGAVLAIVAPNGQRSEPTFDANGSFASVNGPDGQPVQFGFDASGLLRSTTDPTGGIWASDYSSAGQLTSQTNALGGTTTYTQTPTATGSQLVTQQPYGETWTLSTSRLVDGGLSTTLNRPGTQAVLTTLNADGSTVVRSADGTVTTTVSSPDPQSGMQTPLQRVVVQLPSGLTKTTERRASLVKDPSNNAVVLQRIDSIIVNGRVSTSTFDLAQRKETQTTAGGRQAFQFLDARSRPAKDSTPGFAAIYRSYDPFSGLQTHATQGNRTLQTIYDEFDHVTNKIDALNRTTTFVTDELGRPTVIVRPDATSVSLSYDESGSLTSFTPPGRAPHLQGYTFGGLATSYSTPASIEGVATVTRTYGLDSRPLTVSRADGSSLTTTYDAAGRLSTQSLPGGEVRTFVYDATKGTLSGIQSTAGVNLTRTYDAGLVTSERWTGPFDRNVTTTYNSDFRPLTERVNGAFPITYAYDNDGLVTTYGGMVVTRLPNGTIASTTQGHVAIAQTQSVYGELATLNATVQGNPAYSVQLARDSGGRIVGRTETISGATSVFGFAYTAGGYLRQTTKDGVIAATYDYDANGNRISVTTSAGTETAIADSRDRLVASGAAVYGYNIDGDLTSKTVAGATTTYSYDVFGNLRGVVLPNGTQIDYLIDGLNRRVGRKVNGVLTRGWIYGRAGGPIAELDGSGQIKCRFVYGVNAFVPDFAICGSSTLQIISDERGSVRLMIDVNADTTALRRDYDEFGRVTLDTKPGFISIAFAGGIYDELTGLTRFGARDYDAASGRWTSRDPIGFASGSPNLYAYANGDPVNGIDPSGLYTLPETNVSQNVHENLEKGQQAQFRFVKKLVEGVRCWALEQAQEAVFEQVVYTFIGALADGTSATYVGRTNDLTRRELEHGSRMLERAFKQTIGVDDPSIIRDVEQLIIDDAKKAAGLDLDAPLRDNGKILNQRNELNRKLRGELNGKYGSKCP